MRYLGYAVGAVVVAFVVCGAIWIRDTRVAFARDELRGRIASEALVCSKMEHSLEVLRSYLQSSDPLDTDLAREARRQNSNMSDEEFNEWFRGMAGSFRQKVENDVAAVPPLLASKRERLSALEQELRAADTPWLFGSTSGSLNDRPSREEEH